MGLFKRGAELIQIFFPPNNKTAENILAVTILVISSRAFGSISFIYFLLPLILFLPIIIEIKRSRIGEHIDKFIILITLFPMWCIFTSVISPFPIHTIKRGLFLLLITVGLFYIIKNQSCKEFKLYNAFIYSITFVLLASIFSLISTIPATAWSGGNGKGFMGMAVHQNTLGSLILFYLPVLNHELHNMYLNFKSSYNNLPKKIYLITINFISILVLIASHSRGALLSYMIFLMIYSALSSRIKNMIIICAVSIVSTLLVITIPVANDYISEYLTKRDINLISSRGYLYEASYNAAVKGGIIGIGFGISDRENVIINCGRFQENIYMREK